MRLEIHWIPNGSDLSCSTSNISGWKTNRLLRRDNTLQDLSCRRLSTEVGWPPRRALGQAARRACLSRCLQAAPVTAAGTPLLCPALLLPAAIGLGQGCHPCLLLSGAPNCSRAPAKARQPRTGHGDFCRYQRRLGAQCQALGKELRALQPPFCSKALSSPDGGLAEPPPPRLAEEPQPPTRPLAFASARCHG